MKTANLIYHHFGKLKDAKFVGSQLHIQNDEGRVLIMTNKFPAINEVAKHAGELLGQDVIVATSQTTSNWAKTQWFCAINKV